MYLLVNIANNKVGRTGPTFRIANGRVKVWELGVEYIVNMVDAHMLVDGTCPFFRLRVVIILLCSETWGVQSHLLLVVHM